MFLGVIGVGESIGGGLESIGAFGNLLRYFIHLLVPLELSTAGPTSTCIRDELYITSFSTSNRGRVNDW